jgi:hypothetical protein
MRQMAGNRQHQIMMLRRHRFEIGAEHAPKRRQLVDGGGLGPFGRGKNAPAADKKFGKAGVGAGMLGAGDWMRRHEVHSGGQMRGHVAHDRGLHRADIGNDRAALEMRRDLFGDFAASPDWHAGDNEIGAGRGGAVILDDLIRQAQFGHAPARRRRPRGGDNLAHRALRARRAGDRGADQSDADQRQAVKQRCFRSHDASLTSPHWGEVGEQRLLRAG